MSPSSPHLALHDSPRLTHVLVHLDQHALARRNRITPQEFVAAGDFLVYKFPTWEWEGGDKSMQRNYLPADKQYLVQRSGQSSPLD